MVSRCKANKKLCSKHIECYPKRSTYKKHVAETSEPADFSKFANSLFTRMLVFRKIVSFLNSSWQSHSFPLAFIQTGLMASDSSKGIELLNKHIKTTNVDFSLTIDLLEISAPREIFLLLFNALKSKLKIKLKQKLFGSAYQKTNTLLNSIRKLNGKQKAIEIILIIKNLENQVDIHAGLIETVAQILHRITLENTSVKFAVLVQIPFYSAKRLKQIFSSSFITLCDTSVFDISLPRNDCLSRKIVDYLTDWRRLGFVVGPRALERIGVVCTEENLSVSSTLRSIKFLFFDFSNKIRIWLKPRQKRVFLSLVAGDFRHQTLLRPQVLNLPSVKLFLKGEKGKKIDRLRLVKKLDAIVDYVIDHLKERKKCLELMKMVLTTFFREPVSFNVDRDFVKSEAALKLTKKIVFLSKTDASENKLKSLLAFLAESANKFGFHSMAAELESIDLVSSKTKKKSEKLATKRMSLRLKRRDAFRSVVGDPLRERKNLMRACLERFFEEKLGSLQSVPLNELFYYDKTSGF